MSRLTEQVRHIVVLGDVHGHHQAAIHLVEDAARARGVNIDLILQVGDFNASMSDDDAASIPCPAKYRGAGDFARYHDLYPAEVLFIGGNHEPVSVMARIPNGGAVGTRTASQTCHYIGRSGVVERFGLRIAGISGNYSPAWFRKPVEPVTLALLQSMKQQLYIRDTDVARLMELRRKPEPPVDILLMHEWPKSLGVGIDGGIDGQPRNPDGVGYAEGDLLIEHLRPRYCFLGHMHRYSRVRARASDCIALRQVSPGQGETWPAEESVVVLRWDGVALELI